jgi:hypothetical protein
MANIKTLKQLLDATTGKEIKEAIEACDSQEREDNWEEMHSFLNNAGEYDI